MVKMIKMIKMVKIVGQGVFFFSSKDQINQSKQIIEVKKKIENKKNRWILLKSLIRKKEFNIIKANL